MARDGDEADIGQSEGTMTTMTYDPSNPMSLNYQMVETVKNINKFESAIKHKSNVFSVVVENSNLAPVSGDTEDVKKLKKSLREAVTQFVRNTCQSIVPVHTQLFDVQFK